MATEPEKSSFQSVFGTDDSNRRFRVHWTTSDRILEAIRLYRIRIPPPAATRSWRNRPRAGRIRNGAPTGGPCFEFLAGKFGNDALLRSTKIVQLQTRRLLLLATARHYYGANAIDPRPQRRPPGGLVRAWHR